LPNIHIGPKLPTLPNASQKLLKVTGNLPTITKELNQLLKLRSVKHSQEKIDNKYSELVSTIDMILRRKKFVGGMEVEGGGDRIKAVNEEHDQLVAEFDVINDRCKERVYQAHMKKVSVRGDKGTENQIFGSENVMKGIGHPNTAGMKFLDMNSVFKDWQLENAKRLLHGAGSKNFVTAAGNLTDVGVMFLSKYGGRKSIMGI
jgi:DNA mismatch repair ATPase MutS